MARQTAIPPSHLASALKAAVAAGLTVARIEIERDRTVLLLGDVETSPTAPVDELDRELAEFQARHDEG